MGGVRDMEENEIVPILSVEHLEKRFGKQEVVKDLTFKVNPGECFCLFGRSGGGKSTALECIMGLKSKNGGDVQIDGISLDKDSLNFKLNIGFVPSEPALYEFMTGEEFMRFIASSYDMYNDVYEKNYKALLTKFDVPVDEMGRSISSYPYSLKKKVSMMASIIHNPDLWIIDDSTSLYDPMVRSIAIDVVKNFKKAGKGILIVSHDVDFMFDVADRAGVYGDGRIEKVFDIAQQRGNPYVKIDISKIFDSYRGETK